MSRTLMNGTAFLALVLLLTPASARGQGGAGAGGILPDAVRAEVLDRLNDPGTLRLTGPLRLPTGGRIEGPIAVLGGPVEVDGVVAGDLLVVNGDLQVGPEGGIQGDVLVVGGGYRADPAADAPEARVFTHALAYRIRNGRVEGLPDGTFQPGFLASDLGFGQARVTFRAGGAYNRVEGLPVRFGPLIRTAGSNPLSLEALAIWRSVSGLTLDSDRLGYAFRLEQGIGGRGTAFLGATAFRETAAIEDRGMSDAEASLSTFLLHRDVRDYFEREGWSLFLDLRPVRWPVNLTLAYREEESRSALLRRPWTLRSSDLAWRPLPLAAEGSVRTVEARARFDTTDDPVTPSDGWAVEGSVEAQVGGWMRMPLFDEDDPLSTSAVPGGPLPSFRVGSLDVRRYARVSPTARLKLRVHLTGSLDQAPVPPQWQHALGGEGSLPGHPRFSVDCGARDRTFRSRAGGIGPEAEPAPVFANYGCDGTLLFQAEYQGLLPFSWNPVPAEWEDSDLSSLLELRPVWAVFFNAGKGWVHGDREDGAVRMDSPTRADVGVGLFLGPLGLYWSYPLNRKEQEVNFFVRLQRRF